MHIQRYLVLFIVVFGLTDCVEPESVKQTVITEPQTITQVMSISNQDNPIEKPENVKKLFKVVNQTITPESSKFSVHSETISPTDLLSQVSILTKKGHSGNVTAVAFSHDHRLLASGGTDHTVYLWGVNSGYKRRIFRGHSDHILALAFSPNGHYLASSSKDNTIRIWNLGTKNKVTIITGERDNRGATSISFSPDSKVLVSHLESVQAPGNPLTNLSFFDVVLGTEIKTTEVVEDDELKDAIRLETIAFSKNGDILTSPFFHNNLVWNLYKHQEFILNIDKYEGTKFFSPQGKILMIAKADGNIQGWEVKSRSEVFNLHCTTLQENFKSSEYISPLELSKNGKFLSIGNPNGTITIWDVISKREIKTIGISSSPSYAVDFSNDGLTLASSHGNTIQLWDMSSGHQINTFNGKGKQINSLSFSPDGRTIASSVIYDENITLWNGVVA